MPYNCVLKCGKKCEFSETISEAKWQNLEANAKKGSGLDKFCDVCKSTPESMALDLCIFIHHAIIQYPLQRNLYY